MLQHRQNEQENSFPRYTVKEVAERLNLSPHTIRYYENLGLIPFVNRTRSNTRIFSDDSLEWFKLVHCLRDSGQSIEEIRHFVSLCLKGESTLQERLSIITRQKQSLADRICLFQNQMEWLEKTQKRYLKESGNATIPPQV